MRRTPVKRARPENTKRSRFLNFRTTFHATCLWILTKSFAVVLLRDLQVTNCNSPSRIGLCSKQFKSYFPAFRFKSIKFLFFDEYDLNRNFWYSFNERQHKLSWLVFRLTYPEFNLINGLADHNLENWFGAGRKTAEGHLPDFNARYFDTVRSVSRAS